ncbi:KRRI-Interacting protein 1 [Phlyctochytrium bullatum]|nr:KRRI-Interacting protein 1 [Phlyctochytrium bullatum]
MIAAARRDENEEGRTGEAMLWEGDPQSDEEMDELLLEEDDDPFLDTEMSEAVVEEEEYPEPVVDTSGVLLGKELIRYWQRGLKKREEGEDATSQKTVIKERSVYKDVYVISKPGDNKVEPGSNLTACAVMVKKKKEKQEESSFNPNLVPVREERKTRSLLDDDDDSNAFSKLSVNELFAQQYEEKKKREEKKKLEDMYGKALLEEEDEDESEEEEDEDGELATAEIDAQILKTIASIRSKNPEVYDEKVNFFDDEKIKQARQQWNEKQKALRDKKPVTLKDYHRKNLLEGLEEEPDSTSVKTMSLAEEQEQLKREFKMAIDDDDEEIEGSDVDDFLTKRAKSKDELLKEEDEYKSFLLENLSKAGTSGLEDWKAYMRDKDPGKAAANIDPNEAFLLDYVLNKGWVDKSAKRVPTYEEIIEEEHIDDDMDEKMEEFERKFNFRFEEEGGTEIQTYARDVEGTLRRKDTRRAEERKRAKERKEEERKKKDEELKRLKNLKREEIRERLQKIAEVAGVPFLDENDDEGGKKKKKKSKSPAISFDDIDLEEDFDPEKFDRMMQEKFGDNYYTAEDAGIKPVFDDEEDPWDIGEEGYGLPGESDLAEQDFDLDGVLAGAPKAGIGKIRPESIKKPEEPSGDNESFDDENELPEDGNDDFIMDADYLPGGEKYSGDTEQKKGSKKKDKQKSAKKKKVPLDKYLDEYYQLDYEDMIGDLPTRFHYRNVKPDTYGLSVGEILEAPDSALNSFVSLKKIAPFRHPEKLQKDEVVLAKTKYKRFQEFRNALKEAGKTEDSSQTGGESKRKLGQAAKKALKRKKQQEEPETMEVEAREPSKSLSENRLASYSVPKKKKQRK